MKMLATVFCVFAGGLFISSAARGLATAPAPPRFKIEIRTSGDKGPGYAVTNLTAKTVTACFFELSYSLPRKRTATVLWDSLVEGGTPIEPGGTVLRPFFLVGPNAIPDKVEVIAGVWADGESFGQPERASKILKTRATRASEYDDAAAILQQALNQNWTRDQYQQAFSDKPDTGPVYTVRTALSATQQTNQTPQQFTHTMQFLLQTFQQQSAKLHGKAKPL